jgi:hypothetical protein
MEFYIMRVIGRWVSGGDKWGPPESPPGAVVPIGRFTRSFDLRNKRALSRTFGNGLAPVAGSSGHPCWAGVAIARARRLGERLLTSEARFFTHAVAHPD